MKTIKELRTILGIKCLPHLVMWDGHSITARVAHEPERVLHEIAHFQVCPPERRHTPNFGLGGVLTQASQRDHPSLLSKEVHVFEEMCASVLTFYWLKYFNVPCPYLTLTSRVLFYYDNEQFFITFGKGSSGLDGKAFEWLCKNGFLDHDLTPQPKVLTHEDMAL